MDDDNDDSLDGLDCELLASAGKARVAIVRGIKGEYDALDEKQQGRFVGIMTLWCEGRKLAPNMFNYNEGRSKGHNLLIQAFKAFKIRLYGFERHLADRRTFIIVEFDPAKKQDKADPNILKRAKMRADEKMKDENNEAGHR